MDAAGLAGLMGGAATPAKWWQFNKKRAAEAQAASMKAIASLSERMTADQTVQMQMKQAAELADVAAANLGRAIADRGSLQTQMDLFLAVINEGKTSSEDVLAVGIQLIVAALQPQEANARDALAMGVLQLVRLSLRDRGYVQAASAEAGGSATLS